jgi:membrane associated rhomboid family serine protease
MRPAAVCYQCPDCAGEAGRSAPRVRARISVGKPGTVTRVLIAVNVVMFAIEVFTGASQAIGLGGNAQKMFDLGAAYPPAIAAGQTWRLFTSMFLHFGFLHIALNMYALYLFGTLVEEAYGSLTFLALYLVTGMLASVASYAFGPAIQLAAGASGAVFGMLGAWFAYNYRRRDLQFHRAQLQGAVMLIALNMFISFGFHGIDWRAHLGGLVTGAFLGFAAEGFGPPAYRWAWKAGGFAVLIVIGIALVVWRTNELQPLLQTFG